MDCAHYLEKLNRSCVNAIASLIFVQSTSCEASRDSSISIPSVSLVKGLARALVAWIVGLLLVMPITIVNMLGSFALRLVVIEIFSAVLIIAMSMFTKAKVEELFICRTTQVSYHKDRAITESLALTIRERRYAVVLVVFLSGNESHI